MTRVSLTRCEAQRSRPALCPLNLVSYPTLTNASLPFSCRECRSRNIFPNDGSTNGLWAILLRSNDRVCRKSSRSRNTTLWPCWLGAGGPGELLCRPSSDASADHWPMASGGPGIFLRTPGRKLLRIAGNSPELSTWQLLTGPGRWWRNSQHCITASNLSSASRLEPQNQQISTDTFIESVIYDVAKINPLARSIYHNTNVSWRIFLFWSTLHLIKPVGV